MGFRLDRINMLEIVIMKKECEELISSGIFQYFNYYCAISKYCYRKPSGLLSKLCEENVWEAKQRRL